MSDLLRRIFFWNSAVSSLQWFTAELTENLEAAKKIKKKEEKKKSYKHNESQNELMLHQWWKNNPFVQIRNFCEKEKNSRVYRWWSLWAGEAWSKIYGEAQHSPMAAAHVAFGLMRQKYKKKNIHEDFNVTSCIWDSDI